MMMWIGLLGAAFAQPTLADQVDPPCPDQPMQAVLQASNDVLSAYDLADGPALRVAAVDLDRALACVKSAMPPRWVVQVHRAKALIGFFEQQQSEVIRAWAAVRLLDPSVEPDPQRWPPSHPMWKLWSDAQTVEEVRSDLERMPPGGWVIDGDPDDTAPQTRAFLAQAMDEEQQVLASTYCFSYAELPQGDWPLPDAVRERRRKRMRTIGTGVTAGLLVGSAASFGVAFNARSTVVSGTGEYADIERNAVTANTGANIGAGLAAGALTAAVATYTIRW